MFESTNFVAATAGVIEGGLPLAFASPGRVLITAQVRLPARACRGGIWVGSTPVRGSR